MRFLLGSLSISGGLLLRVESEEDGGDCWSGWTVLSGWLDEEESVGRVVEDEFDEFGFVDDDGGWVSFAGDGSDVVEVSEVVVER